jgi:hypothetical protein
MPQAIHTTAEFAVRALGKRKSWQCGLQHRGANAMSERLTYTVRFRPEPRVDGVKALRALLKAALRRFGLKAVLITEEVPTEQTTNPDSQTIKQRIANHE